MFIPKQNNVCIILNTPYTDLTPALKTSFLLRDIIVERIQGIANARKLKKQKPLRALEHCEAVLTYGTLSHNITHYDFLFRRHATTKFMKGLTTQQMLVNLRAKRA